MRKTTTQVVMRNGTVTHVTSNIFFKCSRKCGKSRIIERERGREREREHIRKRIVANLKTYRAWENI